jgi:hypothetical protein
MNRKNFLLSTGSLSAFILAPAFLKSQGLQQQHLKVQEQPVERINPEIVHEFVNVAHTDLSRVKALIKTYPLLLNASWDWGGGDFETALGAAGHMGHKDTANFLLSLGARADIFVLTMLGKTETVKGILALYPNLLYSAGPHGFTLLHHAEKGGEDAVPLMDYFTSLGLTETFIKLT